MTSEGRVCLGLADVKRYGVPKLNLPMAAIREGRIISRPRSRLCYSVASVCPFVCTECIVAKRCVVEQKLLLTTYRKSYEKSIGIKMNDLDLCLKVVSMLCQPLRYIRR